MNNENLRWVASDGETIYDPTDEPYPVVDLKKPIRAAIVEAVAQRREA